MTGLVVIAAATGSSAAAGASSVLQHHSARRGPRRGGFRLLTHLLTRPAWLAGLVAAAAGLVLHAVALAGGDLAVVQPLLMSGVLFALPLSRIMEGRRPSLSQLVWAIPLVLGLAAFLLAARPSHGTVPLDADALAWSTVACGAVLALVAIVATFRRRRGSATLLALTAGLGYGVAAALMKESVVVGRHSFVGLLTDWPPYACIAIGGASIVFTQLAYHAAPLAGSMPALTFADPATSIIVGAVAFHELITHHPVAIAIETVGLLMALAATVKLSSSAHDVHDVHSAHDVHPVTT